MRQYSEIEHLLKLTLAVYKVTAIFPVGEELGLKIRESANKILVNNLLCSENTSRYIGEIAGFFDLAEKKNWVDYRNFLVLRREYKKINVWGKAVEKSQLGSIPQQFDNKNSENNHRQEKILAVMNSNGMVRIGDIIKLFPGVNRRTVLRDLDKLCQVGAAVKNGMGRGSHYVKNGHDNTNKSL